LLLLPAKPVSIENIFNLNWHNTCIDLVHVFSALP
jgi:hypothetical protein